MNLGETIRTFRLKNNLTQEELAQKLSVSSQAVSKWERAESLPDATMLPVIADALGISLDRLFDRKTFTFDDIAHGISHFMMSGAPREQFQDTKKIAHLCEYMLHNNYGAETRIWFNRPRCGMVAILAMVEEYLNHQNHFDLYCGPRRKPYF